MAVKKRGEAATPLFGVRYKVTFFDSEWEPIEGLTSTGISSESLQNYVYVFSLHCEAKRTELSGWKSGGREVCSMTFEVDDGKDEINGRSASTAPDGGQASGTGR